MSEMIESLKRKKIAVVAGGFDGEREVSLNSASNVISSFEEKDIQSHLLEMDDDFLENISAFKPDLVFNSLHGSFGEDGRFQGLLDFLEIPYTGEGHYSSALCFNKIYTKYFFLSNDIPTGKPFFFHNNDILLETLALEKEITYPSVLKKSCSGSTLGVFVVRSREELLEKMNEIKRNGGDLRQYFIEEFLEGKEVTVGVIRYQGRVHILPILGVRAKKGFLDYQAKYTQGGTEFELPAKIDFRVEEMIKKISLDIFLKMAFRQCIRIDFIIRDKQAYVLEVNTSPGNTKTSDIPMMLDEAGIERTDFYVETLYNASYDKR